MFTRVSNLVGATFFLISFLAGTSVGAPLHALYVYFAGENQLDPPPDLMHWADAGIMWIVVFWVIVIPNLLVAWFVCSAWNNRHDWDFVGLGATSTLFLIVLTYISGIGVFIVITLGI